MLFKVTYPSWADGLGQLTKCALYKLNNLLIHNHLVTYKGESFS